MKNDQSLTMNSQLSSPLSQIPLGYKQTEVGVIPEDWDITPLHAVASVSSGGTPDRRIPQYWNGDIPWLTTTQVDFHTIQAAKEFITREGLENSAAKIYDTGTLLMAMYGQGKTRGKVAIMGFPAATNQACAAISLSNLVSNRFIFYNLSSRYQEIRELSNTGNQENLNSYLIKNIPIPLPPTIAEQEAIATTLSDTDALIESLEQLIAKKRQIKQGAMQELLTGKRRLPGFNQNWRNIQLLECLFDRPDYGLNAAGTSAESGNLPTYLRITDIDDDGRLLKESMVAVDHPQSLDYKLHENEIVFARTGASVGKSYLYQAKDGELIFAGFLIRAKVDTSKLHPRFFAFFTQTDQYWNWVHVMSMRSGQPGINSNEYASLNLKLPPIEEQEAIATILSDLDSEIASLETKLTKTRQLKQGMMNQLLTGKIRLVKPG